MSKDKLLRSETPSDKPQSAAELHVQPSMEPIFGTTNRDANPQESTGFQPLAATGQLKNVVGKQPWLALTLAGLSGWAAAIVALSAKRKLHPHAATAERKIGPARDARRALSSAVAPASAMSHSARNDLTSAPPALSAVPPRVPQHPRPLPPALPPEKPHSWMADLVSSGLAAGLASLTAKNSAQSSPGLLKAIYRGRSPASASTASSINRLRSPAVDAPAKPSTFPRPKFDRSRKCKKSWWALLKTTVSDFMEDKAPRLAAALAYYTVFSIAPLLLISIAVAAFFFGGDEAAAENELGAQLERFLGKEGRDAIVAMVSGASKAGGGLVATLVGLGALIFGASAVFAQMKDALNTIWEVEPKPGRGILATILDRALSFLLVLVLGMLLLSSMLASTVLTTVSDHLGEFLPIPIMAIHLINIGISGVVVTAIFAVIFKYLPDVEIHWKDVIIGAAVTTLLFLAGNYGIGMYISKGAVGSAYGPAGSILIVLLWANYSSMIFLLGAEFTQAYAMMYGSQIEPKPDAMFVEKRQ